MAENSKIEWCHHTMNFWVGCLKVSAACDHCYAEAWAKRTGQSDLWAGARRRTSASNWKQPYKWNREAKAAGERRRVFSLSLGDFFDNQADPAWRADAWQVIAECDALDWMILTKRPQNIAKMLPAGHWTGVGSWPWPNVWLGTTAENQEEADRRIPHLLSAPAAVRVLSCEPLLGPLDLWLYLDPMRQFRRRVNLVIAGGESGPGARPMHPEWARSLRDQCKAVGAAFHFKQWGAWTPGENVEGDRCYPSQVYFNGRWDDCADDWVTEADNGPILYRVGKHAAGRLLDGRVWDEMPT